MATSGLRATVEGRVQSNWTATAVCYDNAPFTPTAAPWLKLEIADSKSNQAELGGTPKRRRSVGTIFGEIRTPVGSGSDGARVYADAFATLFREYKDSNLTCDEPTVRTIGEKDGWYLLVVAVPYRYDFFA
jgi:hypothetical protein